MNNENGVSAPLYLNKVNSDKKALELANDILLVLKSTSTQDQIDILQLALDSVFVKRRLNDPARFAQMENEERNKRRWEIRGDNV